MVNLSNLTSCLIDSDVLINWLAQEEGLWEMANELIGLIEAKKIKAFINLTTLMEIRFVLRRKKSFKEETIKKDIAKITNLFEIIVPDELDLIKANTLQDQAPFSPFDAILLSTASSNNITLVSRDKNLIKVAARFILTSTPEEFLAKIKLELLIFSAVPAFTLWSAEILRSD